MTDQRYTDPRLSDPVLRDDENIRGPWNWIAGITILALIAFVVVAGWNSDLHTANSNPSAPMSTSSVSPSTTGSGATSPQPPAPGSANRGAQ